MITHRFAERRAKLASFVKGQGIEGVLITNPTNVRYLTRFTGDSTYLLLSPQFTLLVSDGRYTQQLQEECPGLELAIRPPGQKLTPATVEQLKRLGWSNVGCEGEHVTLAAFEALRSDLPGVQWKVLTETVEQFRIIKDESEITAIRLAIKIAEDVFIKFRSQLKSNDTEIQLHHRLERLLREQGAECGSFPAIVAIGPRAALPHAPPTTLSLEAQELVLVDWGARSEGYVSDLTRTCLISRNVTSRLKTLYDAVLAAQEAAVKTIRPGIPASAVDAAARQAIQDLDLEPYSHGLGHGIGLDVHESPQMRPGVETILLPGMVVTVEPGVYLPQWGGVRIEDDYLITPEGAERLSTLPSGWDSALIQG
jgi:Xaa-Pro aminopeptidase